MSDDSTRPIVIKRIKKVAGGHHGGAWKLAYADFVTAMMAFFLLMWLLGSTAKGDLGGIAKYFQNPLKVANSGGSSSGDAASVIRGGGKDLSRQSGQVYKSDISEKSKSRASAEYRRKEMAALEELKKTIERRLGENPEFAILKKQIILDITPEGLRIQITDKENRPMFDLGSAELKPYSKDLLRSIGQALNNPEVPNRISLAGHTDATQFSTGERDFSNWELSAMRANASRRELIQGGMPENKVLRVVGLASTVPFDRNDPLNPANRRITIVVLNKQTEEAILQENSQMEVSVSRADEIAPGSPYPPGTAPP